MLHLPGKFCLFHGLDGVEILFDHNEFQVDVALLGTLTAHAAHLADGLPGRDGVALLHLGIRRTADPPDPAGSIFDGDDSRPLLFVCSGLHHLACRRGGHFRAPAGGVVHTVVGAPVTQRLAVDQLIAAVAV